MNAYSDPLVELRKHAQHNQKTHGNRYGIDEKGRVGYKRETIGGKTILDTSPSGYWPGINSRVKWSRRKEGDSISYKDEYTGASIYKKYGKYELNYDGRKTYHNKLSKAKEWAVKYHSKKLYDSGVTIKPVANPKPLSTKRKETAASKRRSKANREWIASQERKRRERWEREQEIISRIAEEYS